MHDYKMWQLRMHCNLRQPDTAQSLSTLIFVAPVKFELAQPIHCRLGAFLLLINTLRYAVTLNFEPLTLTSDL